MNATIAARHVQIGHRIKTIRLERKLRQVDLAESAALSWRHLIRMERGQGGEPKPETLDRIAEALGVSRSALTGDEDDEESSMLLSRVEQDVLVALFSRLAHHTPTAVNQ